MKKIGDFFKRIRVEKTEVMPITEHNDNQEIEIHIEGDVNLFKDEKEKIIEGAKQLLAIGKAESMEDAIITCAVMFRGLRVSKTTKSEDGKTIIVLRETAQREFDD